LPLFDFTCRSCNHTFEALVLKRTPKCPECGSEDLEKLLSMPVVHSEGTHARVMGKAKQQEKKTAAEREHAQRQYEASHDD
jgi:putative FmdB family regulatory protein